jgi:hypothetical protein
MAVLFVYVFTFYMSYRRNGLCFQIAENHPSALQKVTSGIL